MNNYDDKIILIKENQKKLLEMVKEKIKEENEIFNLNTKNIVSVLNYDSNVVKKYEAVLEAQKLIEEYTKEILNANSIDEIKEIRKKLNSCINKVKKEMINRGIDDIEYNNYCESVKKYRKRVSENIRYLKREEKINEIENLNNNFDNLNEEELLRLKKLVKNELSYEKRNLGEALINTNNKEIKEHNVKRELDDILSSLYNKKNDKKDISKDNGHRLTINIPPAKKVVEEFVKYDSIEDYLKDRVISFNNQFKVRHTEEYDGSVIKNIVIFTRNIPKLISNKKSAKSMVVYYNSICRKSELYAYSKYITNANSIMHNLKRVVTRKPLEEKENELKSKHDNIARWILDYCEKNHKVISYNKIA